MSGTIVSLESGREYSVVQLLEIVDSLREAIIDGEVVAFAAVGITPAGPTLHWVGSARVLSPLAMLGAIAKLQHNYASDLE